MTVPESFAADFRGELFQPGEAGYDDARRIWNTSIEKRPALIARCSGIADIVAAVKYGRENNLLTAIRGGGHNVGGRALCDDGLVIDLSRMRSVHVNPATQTVRVEGGATLGDLDRETHVFGLAVPVGIVSKTGVGGLTLGGGVGWLVRKYGFSVDNLLSCRVVTADGRIVDTSSSQDPDLFWALRGGGGNFGVVASFEFRGHAVHSVVGGMLIYPRSAAFDVIRNWRDHIETAADELTAYAALMHAPDGTPVAIVFACYCGDARDAEHALAPLRRFGSPVVDAIQPMPFTAMQSLVGPAFPDGNRNYWKSTLQRAVPDQAIAILIEHAARMPSPLSAVVIENYGGAAARVRNDETAYSHRDLPWDTVIVAQWSHPADDEANRNWAREAASAIAAYSARAYLISALDMEPDDVIAASFGSNLPKLAAVKAAYDPNNFFRVNQNIRPVMAQTA